MKKSLLLLVLALGLVLSISTPTLAGEIYHFKGEGASAYWYMYDAESDVHTSISVWAVDELVQEPPGRPQAEQYAWISIFQYRINEKFEPLLDIWSWGPLPEDSLVVERKLAEASLRAEDLPAWMYNYTTGNASEVKLDIETNWTNTSEVISYHDNWHYKSPDVIFNARASGKYREASAQGSITYDDNQIKLEATEWAEIFSAKEGYVMVSK